MLCRTPFTNDWGLQVRCGSCTPCRVYRQKVWVIRCILEATCHPATSFVTLTYDDEHLPATGSLEPRDLVLWLKRLRQLQGPFRFVGIGEYGSRFKRPHYHAIIFGGTTIAATEATWQRKGVPLGSTSVSACGVGAMRYVAGYTLKTVAWKDQNLSGLQPEFFRCSLRPGIGYGALDLLEAQHYTDYGSRYLTQNRDVFGVVRFGGAVYPIGKYLTRHLRIRMGVDTATEVRQKDLAIQLQIAAREPQYIVKLEGKRKQSGWIADRRFLDRMRQEKLHLHARQRALAPDAAVVPPPGENGVSQNS